MPLAIRTMSASDSRDYERAPVRIFGPRLADERSNAVVVLRGGAARHGAAWRQSRISRVEQRVRTDGLVQHARLRDRNRRTPAPITPVANSASDAGSGTAVFCGPSTVNVHV